MSITTIDKLKSYFKKGAKPTQQQFYALLDSYIHKNEDTSYILKGLEGATFMGVATPDSVPPVPTQKVFYIANEVGAYPNYGGLSVADGEIAFFTYNGSWSKVALEDVAKKSEVEDIKSNVNTNVISDNADFNEIVREMVLPKSIDISTISFIRVYNGFNNLYGIKIYSNTTVIVDITTQDANAIILSNQSKYYAVIGKYPSAEYRDYYVSIKDSVYNIDTMPILSRIIRNGQILPYKLEIGSTYGYIDIDTENNVAKVSHPITLFSENTKYVIPSGDYPINISLFSCALVYNSATNSAYIASLENISPTAHVIMVICTSENGIRQVVCSSVPYRINGKSVETKLNTLEDTVTSLVATDDVLKKTLKIFEITPTNAFIKTDNTWTSENQGVFLECVDVNEIKIDVTDTRCVYAFLKTNDLSAPDYATGSARIVITDTIRRLSVPTDAKYLWLSYEVNGVSWFPNEIWVDGQNVSDTFIDVINKKLWDNKFFCSMNISPNLSKKNNSRPLIYEADTKSNGNYIVNAVAYPNGVIIAARAGKGIVRINTDGSEDLLLNISASDWRCLWMDGNMNVFASPHGSAGIELSMESRGLYKLSYGSDVFVKVIALYNLSSSIVTEREENDDTIWTMCEDNDGNLYAGVYSHTKHRNPAIYKSIDGGDTWNYHYNFITSGLATQGYHVHSIIYNVYDNALYAIIGEINTVYKSVDGASTWVDIDARCQYDKGSSMIATPTGILIGSDGAYNCAVAKYYPNGEVKTTGVASANTIFAFRKSDITGRIYAFCKIDSSVTSLEYFPPTNSIEDLDIIENWKATTNRAAKWQQYYTLTSPLYPDDAVKPNHFIIMASDDDGETWYVVYREYAGSLGASGFWTTGSFRNGECLTGRIVYNNGLTIAKPLVVSDGSHCYNDLGLTIAGDIYRKIQISDIVEAL